MKNKVKLWRWVATVAVMFVASAASASDAAKPKVRPIDALLASYEELRADLAVDDFASIAKHAKAGRRRASMSMRTSVVGAQFR